MTRQQTTHVRIISPASREDDELLASRLRDLGQQFDVSYHKLDRDPSWPFTAGTIHARVDQLMEALREPKSRVLLASRGGYGASDLLDHIPWSDLFAIQPKTIIGFSDISALHSAFFTKLGWTGIHGPMPGSTHWGQNGEDDVLALMALMKGDPTPIELPLIYEGRGTAPRVRGRAFGGCLAVLTNLIGTPYFPKNLEGALLYLEDVGEHPSRILRFFNQWEQSGALKGIAGLILGRFVGCETGDNCRESDLRQEIARRCKAPVWFCPLFGHCSPNWPLPVGLPMIVDGTTLTWTNSAHIDKGSIA